jgi:hypothetical protein
MVWLVWSNGPESYADGGVATGRASHAGQVKGDDPDKNGYIGPPAGGWDVGLTNSRPKKNLIVEKPNI